MKFSLHYDTTGLRRAAEKYPDAINKTMRVAMKTSMQSIVDDARQHHKFIAHSGGKAEQSIRQRVDDERGLWGQVFIDTGISKDAYFQHTGTRPHEIRAKTKKALYFVKGGVGILVPKKPYIGNGIKNPFWMKIAAEKKKVVSFKGHVDHPGFPKDQFLFRAFKRGIPAFVKNMEVAIDRAFRMAGLK
jgi:hypothetical protein